MYVFMCLKLPPFLQEFQKVMYVHLDVKVPSAISMFYILIKNNSPTEDLIQLYKIKSFKDCLVSS